MKITPEITIMLGLVDFCIYFIEHCKKARTICEVEGHADLLVFNNKSHEIFIDCAKSSSFKILIEPSILQKHYEQFKHDFQNIDLFKYYLIETAKIQIINNYFTPLEINDSQQQKYIFSTDLKLSCDNMYGVLKNVSLNNKICKLEDLLCLTKLRENDVIHIPKSLRDEPYFVDKFEQKLVIEEYMLDTTDWRQLEIIPIDKNDTEGKIDLYVGVTDFKNLCKKSLENNQNTRCIPILTDDCQIFWVLFINIDFDKKLGISGFIIDDIFNFETIILNFDWILKKYYLSGATNKKNLDYLLQQKQYFKLSTLNFNNLN